MIKQSDSVETKGEEILRRTETRWEDQGRIAEGGLEIQDWSADIGHSEVKNMLMQAARRHSKMYICDKRYMKLHLVIYCENNITGASEKRTFQTTTTSIMNNPRQYLFPLLIRRLMVNLMSGFSLKKKRSK